MTSNGRGPLRTAMTTIAIASVGFVAFKLLEPIFVYNLGWTPMPDRQVAPAVFDVRGTARDDSAARANAVLRGAYASGDFPALSAAIAVDGQLAWRGAIGFSDLQSRTPVSFDDSFRLGSSSKAVTAIAVGTLMAQGKLDLGASLGSLDPSLDAPVRDVTLGQAMSHRAGVRNYGICLCFPIWEHLNRRHFTSVRDAVSVFERDPLLFNPGAGFAYTSFGYNLAGLAVEAASGQSFDVFVDRAVASPLGLETLRVDTLTDEDHVGFYDIEPRGYKRAFAVDNSIRVPSGGYRSSPGDMARLGLAMTDERLLPEEVQGALLAVPPGAASEDAQIYAHGWRVGGWDIDGAGPLIHHNGVSVGSRSIFVIARERGIVLSLMTNKGGESISDLAPIATELLAAFMNRAE
ncbi:MAG: serine hydrolase domain-containing protein [Parvularculaceae bacterium]